MKRVLLLSLFLVLLSAEFFGWDMSLAPGLSIKNAYLYVILLALGVEAATRKRQGHIELLGVHVRFILLISYATLSWFVVSLIVAYPWYTMFKGLIILKGQLIDHYIVFLAFFYGVRSTHDALWVAKYVLWIVMLATVIALGDFYDILNLNIVGTRIGTTARIDGRLQGPLGSSNTYAGFLIFFLPSLAVAIWKTVRLTRVIHILGSSASLAALLLTTSRGALVGLIGSVVLGTVYLRHFIRATHFLKTAIAFTAVGAVVLVIIASQYSDLLYGRFVEQSTPEDLQYASSGRTQIWYAALSKQMQTPVTFIVGFGWATYDAMRAAGEFRYATHSAYVSYLFNLGIIGLGLYLALIVHIVHVTKKSIEMSDDALRPQLIAFLFGFLAIALSTFFGQVYSAWIFIWAYVALMMRVAAESSAKAASITRRSDACNSSGTDRDLLK